MSAESEPTLSHRPATSAIGIALLALVVLLLPMLLREPRGYAGADVRREADHWVVTRVNEGSPAAAAGLRVGDALVAIDGRPTAAIEGRPPAAKRLTEPGLALETAGAWIVDRGGERLTLAPPAVGTLEQQVEPNLLLVVALAFWAAGAVVWLARPGDGLARRFWWMNVAIAAVMSLAPAAEADVAWAKVLEVTAFGLLPFFSLDFFARFTRGGRLGRRGAWAIGLLALLGLGLSAAYLTAGFLASPWYDSLRLGLLALLAIGWIGSLAALAVAFFRPRSPVQRRQLQTVMVGAVLALSPLLLLVLVPEILGMTPLIRPQWAALSLAALPIAVAVAILRDRLLGVELVAERALVHGAMTLALAGAYGVFLWGVSVAGGSADLEHRPLLAITFFGAVALTFVPVRDRVYRLVDRLVYRDRYDYIRTLRRLGARLASAQALDAALADAATGIVRALDLRGAAILLRRSGGDLAVRVAAGAYQEPGAAWALLERTAGDRPADGGERWLPLVANGDEVGLLALGRGRTRGELREEDLHLAETIAREVAMAIANGLLVERLAAQLAQVELLRDRLLAVGDEERKRLAGELHDGPLQTVLAVVRQAKALAEATTADAGSTPGAEQLGRLIELAEDAAFELRVVCADLYPPELADLGLPAALEALARRVSEEESVEVSFALERFPLDHRLDPAAEEALYRLAREALTNVVRHAGATSARVTLGLDGNAATLAIRDDGRGFAPPASFAGLLRRGHLGLAICHERLGRLGGQLTVLSRPEGGGTLLRAGIPLPAAEPARTAPAEEASG